MNGTEKLVQWFVLLASILIVASIACTGTYIYQHVEIGDFPWWPYPAFALLTGFIFWAYGTLSRVED